MDYSTIHASGMGIETDRGANERTDAKLFSDTGNAKKSVEESRYFMIFNFDEQEEKKWEKM